MDKSEALPKWMMRKYAQLWRVQKQAPFTLDQATRSLKEDKKILLVLLSNLRRKGWLQVEFDKEDARKRIYTLKKPEQILEVMESHEPNRKRHS